MEHNQVGELPQHFADRFGWRDLAAAVHDVVEALPADQRAGCLVVTDNYGECGAINYWGLPDGTRPAVSGHNSCFSWWPADFTPSVVLLVGMSREHAEEYFSSVTPGATSRSELAMPYEQEITVWICRGWKVDPKMVRQAERSFI